MEKLKIYVFTVHVLMIFLTYVYEASIELFQMSTTGTSTTMMQIAFTAQDETAVLDRAQCIIAKGRDESRYSSIDSPVY